MLKGEATLVTGGTLIDPDSRRGLR